MRIFKAEQFIPAPFATEQFIPAPRFGGWICLVDNRVRFPRIFCPPKIGLSRVTMPAGQDHVARAVGNCGDAEDAFFVQSNHRVAHRF